MLKQFSFFTLLILVTSSLAIAGQNDPCSKFGYIGAKWICNGIWGNPSTVKQNLPDVRVPNLEAKPKETPAPVVKEEPKTPNISFQEEIPTTQTPEKILVRSSTTFIADKKSDKEEVKTINNDEQNTMRTFEVVSTDILEEVKREAQNKSLLGKTKDFGSLLVFTLDQYCHDPKIKERGDTLNNTLHQDELFIRRTKKQFVFKMQVLQAFWESVTK